MAKRLNILMAEDEATDVLLLRLAVQKAGWPHELMVVQDGKEAIDYLGGKTRYADRIRHPLPALLLLDLKMPRMSGFDVLAWLQNRPDFRELPTVVMTSSANDADRQRALELGASDYFVKPVGFSELIKLVRDLGAKWLDGKA